MSHRLLFLIFACACVFAAHVQAADIRVYTDHSIALQHTGGAQIVFLDAPRRLEQDLSATLPVDPKRAEAIARKRLQTDVNLQRNLAEAWQGVTDAWGRGESRICPLWWSISATWFTASRMWRKP
jgi:integrating conjugative element protein (TIGR03757 family)